jgi:hypothetical protein
VVKEAIRRGEQAMVEEARVNGKAHQNANSENHPNIGIGKRLCYTASRALLIIKLKPSSLIWMAYLLILWNIIFNPGKN